MKRVLSILVCVIFLCGCSKSDKYANYKHYDLINHDYQEFTYIKEDSLDKEEYAIGVLALKDEQLEGYDEGLFYKVGDKDYILILKYQGNNKVSNDYNHTKLYKNKIYLVRGFGTIYEITLDKENSKLKELKFDTNLVHEISDGNHNYFLYGHTISNIDDNYIYFSNVKINNLEKESLNIKCSLDKLICEKML